MKAMKARTTTLLPVASASLAAGRMFPKRNPVKSAVVFLLLLTLSGENRLAAEPSLPDAVQQAHTVLWSRFIDPHGVFIDFTDLDGKVNYPTPEECRSGKPNALGWYQPIENGAMFNGLYLDAAVNRWQHTKA